MYPKIEPALSSYKTLITIALIKMKLNDLTIAKIKIVVKESTGSNYFPPSYYSRKSKNEVVDMIIAQLIQFGDDTRFDLLSNLNNYLKKIV